MRLVVIESPYAGDVDRNLRYVRACMADCLRRGEAPIASHALYTQPGVLDDSKPEERTLGIRAGFLWGICASAVVFYTDLGWSHGMLAAKAHYTESNESFDDKLVFEERSLGVDWDAKRHCGCGLTRFLNGRCVKCGGLE